MQAESTRVLGNFLRDVMKLNLDKKNFRRAHDTQLTDWPDERVRCTEVLHNQ
jgi:phosphoketolase